MAKNMKYEKPELTVLFDDLPAAVGQCTGGIGDSAGCGGGASPGTVPPSCTGGTGF